MEWREVAQRVMRRQGFNGGGGGAELGVERQQWRVVVAYIACPEQRNSGSCTCSSSSRSRFRGLIFSLLSLSFVHNDMAEKQF